MKVLPFTDKQFDELVAIVTDYCHEIDLDCDDDCQECVVTKIQLFSNMIEE